MSRGSLRRILIVVSAGAALPALARLDPEICGTHPDRAREDLFLHRQSMRRRVPAGARAAAIAPDPGPRDAGEIALIDDSNGVVGRRNPFDLNGTTLQFEPSDPAATRYRFALASASFDDAAVQSGVLLRVGDDDSRLTPLPFAFPFFGASYQQIYVNSDGNLTFTGGDAGSTDRSFGRFNGGLPRIAPLFADLDPARAAEGIFVSADPSRFVVSWVRVPLYASSGVGRLQTFQARLYPDGRIDFAWQDAVLSDAVAGIAPGRLTGTAALVSFSDGSPLEFSAAVGERFSGSDSIDVVAAAQQFYATHDDAYDYLAIFTNEPIAAAPGAVAYEVTVRNRGTGFGVGPIDIGEDFGSPHRLQAVLNMGPLSQYPADPDGIVPARLVSRDTPLTVLGHEAGHLFLAYSSVPDPRDPQGQPMLGRQLAHWSFLFNSEASLLEGNRIQDNGADRSPRFTTVATVEGYAPLDQYLMGFRAPEEVPPTFLVTGSPEVSSGVRAPQAGVSFNGTRRDISVEELAAVAGRRTPDSTVAQRRFRFAFLLVVPAGSAPSSQQIAQLEGLRTRFEAFYEKAASSRAGAETALRRSLRLSVFPAAGLIDGSMIPATLTISRPAEGPVAVLFESQTGGVAVPPGAVIRTGATSTTFYMLGLKAGVDTITARPADPAYETAFAKIQVTGANSALHLEVVSTSPVVLRVADGNGLPYSNIVVRAAGADGQSEISRSDLDGLVRFQLEPRDLRIQIAGGPSLTLGN